MNRRQFLIGTGAVAVGFSLLGDDTTADAADEDGLVRVIAQGQAPTAAQSWLVLTAHDTTIYSGKVELGTGVQTALTQMVVEELRLGVADVQYVQGDTQLCVSQGTTAGSKTIQIGGPQLRDAAATAFAVLSHRAAAYLGVDPSRLVAADGRFFVRGRRDRGVGYPTLLASAVTILPPDPNAATVPPSQYTVVGRSQPRVDLPAKLTATFRYINDIVPEGTLHGRVVRPPGRNATDPIVGNLARAKAIDGFVDVVQRDRFIAVVATSEWAAVQAASPTNGITVSWTAGPAMIAQADLPTALRDPVNQYRSVVEIDGDVDPVFAAAPIVVSAQYFTPFQMHGAMGASCAVADVRPAPDPVTGMQVMIWSATQDVTQLRGAIALLLGLDPGVVRVSYQEDAGCYGHNGADDCAADAALLSQAMGRPVRVQWRRQDEHGWEPLGGAQAHDMRAAFDTGRITAWSHLNYAPSVNSRPIATDAGSLLAGTLVGLLPPPLPSTSVDSAGRNAPVTYHVLQRVEDRLIKTFDTTGPDSATPSAPLTYRIPRTSALRTLGGFSNSFTNESFFDEVAHAAGEDPLELRIASLVDPRAVAVCEALRDAWRHRPAGGDGTGAGVSFQQYETTNAYVATYAEVTADRTTGQVSVTRVLVAHDCGLIINPDGLRNQIQGNVIQGVSRTLEEEVQYSGDAITSVVWQTSPQNPGPPYSVIRFDQIPDIEIILIDRPDQPPLGAGEPTLGTMGGAIGNAVYAAIGVRIRTLPFTPARVLGALNAELSAK
jgi:CO/xanthine dehydrogenase Mo-binding subunit